MSPLVSILILAHNKAAHTQRCLDGLLKSTHDKVQFVFVDNGSTDEIPQVFADFTKQAEARGWSADVVTHDSNIGAVSGRNSGLPLLKGEYVVVMDNDVTPRTLGWMETLMAYLQANPDVGVVQPKLIYPVAPYLIQCAGCDVSPAGKVNFRGRGARRDDPAYNEPRECQALISAVYVPDAELYHFENVTSGGTARMNYTYLTMKNNRKFRLKWQHRFSEEGGPDSKTMQWAGIEPVRLEDVGNLEQY